MHRPFCAKEPILVHCLNNAHQGSEPTDYYFLWTPKFQNSSGQNRPQSRRCPVGTLASNIIDNNLDAFNGNRLVIFYAKDLGLWPHYIDFDITKPVNGGVPQVGCTLCF
jgi:hypothetical protein